MNHTAKQVTLEGLIEDLPETITTTILEFHPKAVKMTNKTVTFELKLDRDMMKEMIRRALTSAGGKCKDGPLTIKKVTVINSREVN